MWRDFSDATGRYVSLMERKKVNVRESGMWAPRWPSAAPPLHSPLTAVCLTGGFESLRFQALFRPVAPGDDVVDPWGIGSFPIVCLECDSGRLALTRAVPWWWGPSSASGMLVGPKDCLEPML